MLEKISTNRGFGYKDFNEMKEKSPLFKKGVEDFKKGIVNTRENVKAIFYKKLLSNAEYRNKHEKDISTCNLGSNDNGMLWVGFLGVVMPSNAEEMTDDDMRNMDLHYRAYNISPTPLSEL